jgi:hypothetical protein
MANDRMFLRNKRTGKEICIATYSGGLNGWCSHPEIEKINDFFEDSFCESPQDYRDYEINYEHSYECTKEQCVCEG